MTTGTQGSTSTTTGNLSFGQLEALWIKAGGPYQWAPTMAGVALAESGGNPNAQNASGATGLWQVLLSAHPHVTQAQMLSPAQNAAEAVKILGGGGGITAWSSDPVGKLATANKGPLPYSSVLSTVKQMGFSVADAVDTASLGNLGKLPSLSPSVVKGIEHLGTLPPSGLKSTIRPTPNMGGGPLNAIASDFSGLTSIEHAFTDLTTPGLWLRIGEGLAGIALIIGGFVLFVSTSDTGKKAISTGAEAAVLA